MIKSVGYFAALCIIVLMVTVFVGVIMPTLANTIDWQTFSNKQSAIDWLENHFGATVLASGTAVETSLIPSLTNTYDLGSNSTRWRDIYVSRYAYIGSLTAGRVPYQHADGYLADDAGLTYDASTNTVTVGNVSITAGLSATSVTDSGLTAGRVTLAGAGGLLADDADLTFSGGNTLVGTVGNFTTLNPTNLGATTLTGAIAGGGQNVTNLGTVTATTGNITTLNAPTGRSATITIAGSNVLDATQADYVATGTDDQIIINAAFSAARSLSQIAKSIVMLGDFNVSSSINATGFSISDASLIYNSITLDLRAAQIHASTFTVNNTLPVLDLSGSSNVLVLGGQIDTGTVGGNSVAPTNYPSSGIFMARMTNVFQTGTQNTFIGTRVRGYFGTAAIYSYASECTGYYDVQAVNFAANAQGVSWNSANPAGLTSPFVAIVAGLQSNSKQTFWNGEIAAVGGNTSVGLYVEGASDSLINSITVSGVFFNVIGLAAIELDATNWDVQSVQLSGIRIGDNKPTYGIYGIGSNVIDHVTLTNSFVFSLTKDIYVPNAPTSGWLVDGTNYFHSNTGVSFYQLTSSNINHPSFTSTTNEGDNLSIFDPALEYYVPLYSTEERTTPFISADNNGVSTNATGTTWTTLGRSLASGDYLAANATSLDFTSGNFSGFAWIYPTTIVGSNRAILNRGLFNTDGWDFYINANGALTFTTYQAGANQAILSAAGAIVVNQWQFVGFERNGTAGSVWLAGKDITFTALDPIVDPLTSARNLEIGIYDDLASRPFIGIVGEVYVFSDVLTTLEKSRIFNSTKAKYGYP